MATQRRPRVPSDATEPDEGSPRGSGVRFPDDHRSPKSSRKMSDSMRCGATIMCLEVIHLTSLRPSLPKSVAPLVNMLKQRFILQV